MYVCECMCVHEKRKETTRTLRARVSASMAGCATCGRGRVCRGKSWATVSSLTFSAGETWGGRKCACVVRMEGWRGVCVEGAAEDKSLASHTHPCSAGRLQSMVLPNHEDERRTTPTRDENDPSPERRRSPDCCPDERLVTGCCV